MDDKGNRRERADDDGKRLERSSGDESGQTRPASDESGRVGGVASSSAAAAGGGGQRRQQAAMRQAAMATGGRRQWQRQWHLQRQWRQTATVVTAGYGGEGTSSGSRADVHFFVSVPRAYTNMVSLLPLALPPLRPCSKAAIFNYIVRLNG